MFGPSSIAWRGGMSARSLPGREPTDPSESCQQRLLGFASENGCEKESKGAVGGAPRSLRCETGAQVGKARPFNHILLSRFLVGDVSATETKWDVVRSSFGANLMRDTGGNWRECKWSQIVTRLSQVDTAAPCTLSPDRRQDSAERRKLAG